MASHPSDSSRQILTEVNAFYEANPFPGFNLQKYSYEEDLRQRASWLGRLFDAQIPYHAKILDAGCGTGQLANFLALKQRTVLGIDYSRESLAKATALRDRLGIAGSRFEHANLLDLRLPENHFDYVLCLGVLHHTGSPYTGFRNLVRVTHPGGYLAIGLYNTCGRFAVKARRRLGRMLRSSKISQAAIQRQLGGDLTDMEKNESWLADQYDHPHESTHTVGEVLHWFKSCGIEYVNSIPPIEIFHHLRKSPRVFKSAHIPGWRRGSAALLLKQLKWILTLRDNGGYFIVIGRKG